ncbi:MAG: lysoplasmalogenase [Halieaceae bacterium]|nr:lysoplasmalogenase [Halieaceae bacterium]
MITDTLQFAQLQWPATLSITAVIALVVCDLVGYRPGRYLFKPLAALAFVWLALALGALESTYGGWLLAGLLCCLLGDLLLMPDSERCFLGGLVAFLCGHLLYAVAFWQLPHSLAGVAATAIPALVLLRFVGRWLLPRVPAQMKIPVTLYTLVITGMLLCAGLTASHPAAALVITGAWGFAVSDLAVARRQFVQPSRWNGLWGTPLYFFSQMLLAASVALA